MGNSIKTHVDHSRESIVWRNPAPASETDILYVELAGVTQPDINYAIRRTRNSKRNFDNLYVIEYVVSGTGYIESEGIRTQVNAGDLYIIHRRTVHSYYADRQKPFCKKWLNVSGTFINAMEDVFFSDGPFTVIPLGTSAETIMDAIHATLRNTNTDFGKVRGTVMKLLLDLFLLMDEHRKSEMVHMTQYEKIAEYIDQNIYADLNVNSIADKFFISSSTLYRIFMTNAGMSPKAYIIDRKIEVAKRMIAANNSTFNTIASTLGFYDSHHFFRAFRASTGQSPSEYRKQILQANTDD